MTNRLGLTSMSQWKRLENHYEEIKKRHLRVLFREDGTRADRFSLKDGDMYYDFSKNIITQETLDLLVNLAEGCGLADEIEKMFCGNKINETEDRAVLHTALRNMSNLPVYVDGCDVMPKIKAVLDKMKTVSEKIRNLQWYGFTGMPVKNIVNIGIGGSDLGPVMAYEALKSYSHEKLNIKFISNVDGTHLYESLKGLAPEETLFIVASKTFTTEETMTNALSAKKWLLDALGKTQAVEKHFLALSTNVDEVINFGIDSNNMFDFWDWVGGRFSLTSAVGLSLMISIGYENFIEFLNGFFEMDNHFRTKPFRENIPVIMALLGIWYNNFFNFDTYGIFPYEQYLHRFPAFLQQGDMESNGKCVNRNGKKVNYLTGPVIWGEPGTNGQHAFFQLIHQGTKIIPVDFICFINPIVRVGDHHDKLISNMFAQAEALAFGKTEDEVRSDGCPDRLVPYRIFEGNRPSSVIVFDMLTPSSLGKLIATYEHKIFTQGVIWDVYSFDQWGVELGKILARQILKEIKGKDIAEHDSSTLKLIEYYRAKKFG